MIALYLACLENADDRRRFEEIWHACKRLVFHTAYTILRDEHLAEDVMQEAFFYLARHFPAPGTAAPAPKPRTRSPIPGRTRHRCRRTRWWRGNSWPGCWSWCHSCLKGTESFWNWRPRGHPGRRWPRPWV